MIPRKRLEAVKTIVTHRNAEEPCADGVASAILLHEVLPKAEIVFCQLGTRQHAELPVSEGMLFCDLAPPRARALEFARAGAIVLDHHRGSQDIVENMAVLGRDAIGIFADESIKPGVSGALLAFRYVWTPLAIGTVGYLMARVRAEAFARLVGIRDTWQAHSALWDQACAQAAALRFWPIGDWLMHDPFFTNFDVFSDLLAIGPTLIAKQKAAVAGVLERAWRTTTRKGTRLVIFEGTSFTSDAAEQDRGAADLVLGFGYQANEGEPLGPNRESGDFRLLVSSRSHTNFDCMALAKAYGGGGHTRAAGFSERFQRGLDPYARIWTMVNGWEQDGIGGL